MALDMEIGRGAAGSEPQRVTLNNYDEPDIGRHRLAEELASGRPHQDLRDWLQMVDAIAELRVLEGVDWEENIGRITEMLHHTDGAPAVLFDSIPGYPAGCRLLVNAQGERSRLALTLGLPHTISVMSLMDEWERRMDSAMPIPPEMVATGPVMQNVLEGEAIDLWKFPTPKWHAEDGGRYIGTGDNVITRDPDDGSLNVGTYRVMIHDRRHTGLYISPGKGGRIHRDKYFARGEDMPAVIVLGADPLLFLGGCLEIRPGLSEL
ncbi:MAG: UbiD family decarboxylase, partial [Chloroflexota bacterium]|nr:UbiD family decarboxylase [Chloroflexota bacterium]